MRITVVVTNASIMKVRKLSSKKKKKESWALSAWCMGSWVKNSTLPVFYYRPFHIHLFVWNSFYTLLDMSVEPYILNWTHFTCLWIHDSGMCMIILLIIRSDFILTGTLSKNLVPLSKHQETRWLLLLGGPKPEHLKGLVHNGSAAGGLGENWGTQKGATSNPKGTAAPLDSPPHSHVRTLAQDGRIFRILRETRNVD